MPVAPRRIKLAPPVSTIARRVAPSCHWRQRYAYYRHVTDYSPMILVCPECGARYRLADGAIPLAGRSVQCASCKHSWHASAPVAAEPVVAPPPAPATAPRLAPAPIPRPAAHAVAADTAPQSAQPAHWLWTASAIVAGLVLTVLAASVWRADLSALGVPLPATAASAAAPVESPLLIEATVQLRVLPSGGNFMAVTGTITNPTKTEQPVVAMVADLLDMQGQVLDSWAIPAPLSVLPPGRSVGFDSAANNVDQRAASLSVHFPGIKSSPNPAS
jgi:predicted Zn finger-like uncharacterized protein